MPLLIVTLGNDMSAGRLTNLILSAIFGLMIGWFFTWLQGCSYDPQTQEELSAADYCWKGRYVCGPTDCACVPGVFTDDGGTD